MIKINKLFKKQRFFDFVYIIHCTQDYGMVTVFSDLDLIITWDKNEPCARCNLIPFQKEPT